MFDDEFTTVDYLDSMKTSPSWSNLVENSCETVTDKQFNIARTWYEGEEYNEATTDLPDDDNYSNSKCEQTRETTPVYTSTEPSANSITSRPTNTHDKTRRPMVGSSVGSGVGTSKDISQIDTTVDAGASVGSPQGSRKSKRSLSKKTRELHANNKLRDDSDNVKSSTYQPFVDIASLGLRRGKRKKKRPHMLEHPSDVKKLPNKIYGMLLVESYNTIAHSFGVK